jgi:UDP:flavonoid glycosyltransferase YjiC (YdhE family)
LKNRKNILISPLEWGLGHAARIVPIAKQLRELDNNVIIASGRSLMPFFRTELPDVQLIEFPGFRPVYSAMLPQYLVLLLQTPFLIYQIVKEHYALKKIITENKIDIVISDNRFGLWNKSITTAYITHMPLIPFPLPFRFLEFIGKALHLSVISKYSLCFIPDLPGGNNLSGRLSHGFALPQNVRYIGILSRFSDSFPATEHSIKKEKSITVILSGPEPQRSILKKLLARLLNDHPGQISMLGGDPAGKNGPEAEGNITYFNHLSSDAMSKLISSAESVICRSGYTTIMELASLKCSALLIPTPGQTEQEYLAEYLSGKGCFSTLKQNEIRAVKFLPEIPVVFPDELLSESADLLIKALEELSE